jgi:hypothetical protein
MTTVVKSGERQATPTYICFSIFLGRSLLKKFLKNKTAQALGARLKGQLALTFFLLHWFFCIFIFFINFI